MVNQTNLRLSEESEIHHNLSTHEIEHEQGIESDSEISETETRGPTCMKSILGRPLHLPKIHVEYNNKGDPVDGECSMLSHFLGSIARNCQYCPISVKDWRNIENKDEILVIVKILSYVGKKWRSWKNRLKAKYWYEASVEVLVDQRDARVTAVEWMKICTYWNSDVAKKVSRNRKNARAKRVNYKKTGQTSFARVEYKMTKKNGQPPNRVELLRACFLNRNGDSNCTRSTNGNMQEDTNKSQEDVDDPIDEDDDPIHQDDVFAQTIGQDQSNTMQMTSKEISQSKTRETTENTSKRLRIEEQGDAGQQSLTLQVPPNQKTAVPTLKVGSYVSLKSVSDPTKIVAKGSIESMDPSKDVGGHILGPNWCEVFVAVSIVHEEHLFRGYGKFQKIGDVTGEMIAWPCTFVCFSSFQIMLIH
ncbi:OLC1v1030556C1 [Oldenlandia corymbosa var. corymbosa]|uniref:OLC1v1030556C1 n=1 Tax=Oldenlandia corymbosa var. corymbosa TaxID=529605 RepID=A0AAV1CH34_OLDCO|nr:OLC1v1030556C1 [Oldenlandia corymbosa var. corymbosa]